VSALGFALLLSGAAPAFAQAPATPVPGVIGEVRVHGNHTTPDADVLALAGLAVGTRIAADTLAAAEERLRAAGRFSDVEIRKRFRSLADPSDILVIVLVDEVAGISAVDLTPGPMKRLRGAGMWLPVLDYADGYGFTYGARVSFVDVLGQRSRISVPLTWGGERRVAWRTVQQNRRHAVAGTPREPAFRDRRYAPYSAGAGGTNHHPVAPRRRHSRSDRRLVSRRRRIAHGHWDRSRGRHAP